MNKVMLYTDGGCRGNGKADNVGAWGVIMLYGEHDRRECKAIRSTTNNQMELQAVIEGLKNMKLFNLKVEVYSDSAYVVNGINSWVHGWERNGWLKKDGKPPENLEQWKELLALTRKFTDLSFIKVKGHSGDKYNEEVDLMVNKAMDSL